MRKINSYKVILMGIITLLGFPLLAWITVYFFIDEDPIAFLWPLEEIKFTHFLWGLIWGTIAGFSGITLVNHPYIKKSTIKYEDIIESMDLNLPLVIFLSFSAGVGEEFFFRGALQPLWGNLITSVFFVAIHGYLNPLDKRIFVYGALLTAFIYSVGYLYEKQSIATAIAAHFAYDLVLLMYYLKKAKKKRIEEVIDVNTINKEEED